MSSLNGYKERKKKKCSKQLGDKFKCLKFTKVSINVAYMFNSAPVSMHGDMMFSYMMKQGFITGKKTL